MGKLRNGNGQNEIKSNILDYIDDRDKEILGLLVSGQGNRQIAASLKILMSTVQRRTRKLFEKGIVRSRIELDYQKLGLRKGLLHVYLKEGHINSIAEKVSHIKGIQSATIHIGNSDIVGVFVFKDAAQLLEIMNYAKKIEGVDKVVWSEEVFTLPSNGESYALEGIAKGNH